MSHAVDLLFYVEDFLHQVNALVVVGTLGQSLAFLGQLEEALSKAGVH